MKINILKSLAAAGALLVGAAALTGCQDRFDDWNLGAPVAENKANISILDFKKEFWQDSENFCVEIPAREDGSHYIISGRVISSDEQGNVFKCLYIQDETGVMPLSINQYSLYINNRIGQEIVIDLTGLYCGRYSGLFQIGSISYDEKTGDAGTSFMAPEIFNLHREYNGNPGPALVDTLLIEDISSISGDLQKWQGQMVRFNNVTFTNAHTPGKNKFCDEYHSSGYNQEITGSFGTVEIRTSGYSTFWNENLPTEACDVVGILGYYNGDWQIILNDIEGIMNVGNPTAEGIKTKPYTIERAIELSEADNTTGWVKGYIVGTLQPELTAVTSDADIQWIGSEPFIMDNYLVIAPSPETRDYTKCLLVPVTAGSALYTYGNLADNPDNAGRTLNIRGRFSRNMGMAYLAANDGTPTTFEIEGVDVPGSDEPEPAEGDGSENSPFTVAQAIKAGSGNAWVKGIIVGTMNSNNNYTLEVAAPFSVASNVYLADKADESDTANMLPVQLVKGTDIRKAVNLLDNPGNLGKLLTIQGTLDSYFKQPGLKEPTAYKLDGQGSGSGDTPNPPATDGGTEDKPYSVTDVLGLNNPGTTSWVEGYIVGSSNGANGAFLPVLAATGHAAGNILLAADANETDPAKMIPVQLLSGTDIRAALNLVDNPGNFGKKLKIEGKLSAYFSRPGMRSPSAYVLL